MVILHDFAQLIAVPPGDLIYYLVTVFAIQLILGIAVGHWVRHREDPGAGRLLILASAFTLARLLLVFVAGLDRAGVLSANTVIPPVERFLSFVLVPVTLWALLPVSESYYRLSILALLLIILAALLAYAASATLWLRHYAEGVAFGGDWQALVWAAATAVAVAVAFVTNLVWRSNEWSATACLLTLWFVGHCLQLVLPDPALHHPAWVRLADLAGLPLLANIVYRTALRASLVSEQVDHESPPFLELIHQLVTDHGRNGVPSSVAATIARVARVDVVAVGLRKSAADEVVSIVALYPVGNSQMEEDRMALSPEDFPIVQAAVRTGQPQAVRRPRQDPNTLALLERLGIAGDGPLLVQPLSARGEAVGFLVAANPSSQKPLEYDSQHSLSVIADLLALSLCDQRLSRESLEG
ncbi:MAG: hypothetical protein GX620_18440, partial [Chloroflexi bacterium]|nr:hypothetical protein [Chloroflexota bacterium]